MKLLGRILSKFWFKDILTNEKEYVSKSEQFLNHEEINIINKEAKKSYYSNPQLIILTTGSRLDIRKVSKRTGLILIDGNEFFGFEHINKRHSYHNKEANWKNSEKQVDILGREFSKLDYPSRFSKDSIPIFDYLDIADALYSPKNLNTEKNKDPEKFELYIGKTARGSKELQSEYKLIVYKNSKIIHTLFPTDRKTKKKKIKGDFNFVRKSVSAVFETKDSILMLKVPYSDFFEEVRYIILIRRCYKPKLDKFYLQINEPKGKPAFTYYIDEKNHDIELSVENLTDPKEIQSLEFSDLSSIENLIGKFERLYFNPKKKQ